MREEWLIRPARRRSGSNHGPAARVGRRPRDVRHRGRAALTVVATSRGGAVARSRRLRTQGLDARRARALAARRTGAALAVVSVIFQAAAIGVVVPWALTDALGWTCSPAPPAPPSSADVGARRQQAAAARDLRRLVAAVLVESAVRRRGPAGEVLRVGER